MSVTLCQGGGFLIALLGSAGIMAATVMNRWSTQDLYNNPVTATFNYQGLWQTCIQESSGFTECRGYFTILGLPGMTRNRLRSTSWWCLKFCGSVLWVGAVVGAAFYLLQWKEQLGGLQFTFPD